MIFYFLLVIRYVMIILLKVSCIKPKWVNKFKQTKNPWRSWSFPKKQKWFKYKMKQKIFDFVDLSTSPSKAPSFGVFIFIFRLGRLSKGFSSPIGLVSRRGYKLEK